MAHNFYRINSKLHDNFFEFPTNITLQNIDRLTIIWYIENKQKVQIWLEIKLMLLKPRNY